MCECATNACKSVFLINRRTAFVERVLLPRNTSSGFKIDVLNSTPFWGHPEVFAAEDIASLQ